MQLPPRRRKPASATASSTTSKMVMLSLILERARIKALVKDKQVAVDSFGTYVEDGFISEVGLMKGCSWLLIEAAVDCKLYYIAKLAERDEEEVTTSGIPYTIIEIGSLQSTPGGSQGFSSKRGIRNKGWLCRPARDTRGYCKAPFLAAIHSPLSFHHR
ncbi:uncharacterized protein [Typha angustifolia]|uniref:uncharacterized protein n=1 Tax=Typha angustifolia TaxID=59011 RepID=UPI003C30C9D1